MHIGRVQAGPPTTADCEKAYKVACYQPAQIRQAYDLPWLYARGVTGRCAETYSSYRGAPAGWSPVCGTSEATPLFAGIVALAAQVAGHPLGPVNPALYRLAAGHARGIVDVTKGNTTVSFTQGGRRHTVRGFTAAPGYDLASGVGTVDGRYFVRELASAVGH